MDGALGVDGMAGSNGLIGPMGMNGSDAVLHINNVNLLNDCEYLNISCDLSSSSAGCTVDPFPVVEKVRMHEQVSNFYYFTNYLEFCGG